MISKMSTVAFALSLVVATGAPAFAGSQPRLAAGKPAGVRSAQEGSNVGLIMVGAAVVVGGLVLVASSGGGGPTTSTANTTIIGTAPR